MPTLIPLGIALAVVLLLVGVIDIFWARYLRRAGRQPRGDTRHDGYWMIILSLGMVFLIVQLKQL